jgi:hypothetical protein
VLGTEFIFSGVESEDGEEFAGDAFANTLNV